MPQIHDGFAYFYLSGDKAGKYQLYVLAPSRFNLKGVGFGDASTYVGGLPSTTTRIDIDLETETASRQYHVCRYDIDLNAPGYSGDTTIIIAVHTIAPGSITTHETKVLYNDADFDSALIGFQTGKHVGVKIDNAPYTLLKFNSTHAVLQREPSVLVHRQSGATVVETSNATSPATQVKSHITDISNLSGSLDWFLCAQTDDYTTSGATGRFESEVAEAQLVGGGQKKAKKQSARPKLRPTTGYNYPLMGVSVSNMLHVFGLASRRSASPTVSSFSPQYTYYEAYLLFPLSVT